MTCDKLLPTHSDKKPGNRGFHHNLPATHKGYNFAVEFIIIGQSRHEKDLVSCLMRILARCVEVLRQTALELLHRDIQQQTGYQVFLMDREATMMN